jgi:Flp pilus assembly protein TadG
MAFLRRRRDPTIAQPRRPSRLWLRGRDRTRGQTMVEVALVLPIFIFTLMAVLEMGYFVAVGSAVSSASREAARFGATNGCVDGDCADADVPQDYHYVACDGVRDAARSTSGALVNLTNAQIVITYEGTGAPVSCPAGTFADPTLVERWDRIVVTVTHTYAPLTPLLRPIMGNQAMESIDRRSIVKP